MALHGPIKVNHLEVGYWSAQRIETGADGVNVYACIVDYVTEGEVGVHRTFPVTHDYRDGAAVLAAKVLAKGTGGRWEPVEGGDGDE